MVQRHDRRDVALEQLVDEPCVEVEAALVDRPATLREDPRPGHAEAIRLEPDLLHQVEILRPAVVVVAGDVPGVAVLGHAGRVTEAVPDRLAAPVLGDGALDLVRGRGGPPQEISRERHGGGSPRDVELRLGLPTIARGEGSRTAMGYTCASNMPRVRVVPALFSALLAAALVAGCAVPGEPAALAAGPTPAAAPATPPTEDEQGPGTAEPAVPEPTERVTLPSPTFVPPRRRHRRSPRPSRSPRPRSRTAPTR